MSKISMFDPSIKFRMASRSTRPGGNVNVDVDAIGKIALNTSAINKTLKKITLPAQVQRTYDKNRGCVRPFPMMWEYGGRISDTISRCVVLATPEYGMIGPFSIAKIKLLQQPSSWQAATEVYTGMHIVIGYANRGDVKVLVYKIVDTMAVSEVRTEENDGAISIAYEAAGPDTQNDIAALNCELVGFYSKDWRGDETHLPAAAQPLLGRVLHKLETSSNLPVNFEPFNLIGKSHTERNVHFELDADIPVDIKPVPAGSFVNAIIRISTEYREDQREADNAFNEGKPKSEQQFNYAKATNWRLVYEAQDDGTIKVTAIHTKPVEVFGNPLAKEDVGQSYSAVESVFKDITSIMSRGDALAIRKANHQELYSYLTTAGEPVVVYMRCAF